MDHIWEAPSRLKKTLAHIFFKKLAIILRQDFLKTLYTKFACSTRLSIWYFKKNIPLSVSTFSGPKLPKQYGKTCQKFGGWGLFEPLG